MWSITSKVSSPTLTPLPLINHMLTKIPNTIEIKEIIFNLNKEGAPGPNGFNTTFYFKPS